MEVPIDTHFPEYCTFDITATVGSKILISFMEVILGPAKTAFIAFYEPSSDLNPIAIHNEFTRAIYGYDYYDRFDTTGFEPADELGKKPLDLLDMITSSSEVTVEIAAFPFFGTIAEAYDKFKFSIEISAIEAVPQGKVFWFV